MNKEYKPFLFNCIKLLNLVFILLISNNYSTGQIELITCGFTAHGGTGVEASHSVDYAGGQILAHPLEGVTRGNVGILQVFPITVGLQEVNELDIQVFPNPTANFLEIHAKEKMNLTYSVFNSMGRLIHRRNSNSSFERIDLSARIAGIYYLKVNNFENQNTYKITKI